MARAVSLAAESLPQMNIDGLLGSFGLTISPAPTDENAFTNLTWGAFFCSRSRSDESSVVKNRSSPFSGGADSEIGFVVSSTTLPFSPSPQSDRASSAAAPLTASTSTSPNCAASANVPVDALAPAPFFQSASFAG